MLTYFISGVTMAQPSEPELPRQMAWTAYNLGTTGYNQAVAIGAMLREKYDTTLRVIPGQNDVSRLLPLKTGRVDFSANGVATYFAQEGTFQFASQEWGPQPLRLLMTSNGLSNQAVAVAADTGIALLGMLYWDCSPGIAFLRLLSWHCLTVNARLGSL